MTDRERINKAYGLLKGAGSNSYLIDDGGIKKVPIPLTVLGEVTNILDDNNYEQSDK